MRHLLRAAAGLALCVFAWADCASLSKQYVAVFEGNNVSNISVVQQGCKFAVVGSADATTQIGFQGGGITGREATMAYDCSAAVDSTTCYTDRAKGAVSDNGDIAWISLAPGWPDGVVWVATGDPAATTPSAPGPN